MNDNSPKQCDIENLEDMHDLIIMNEYEERKANNEVEYISFENMREILEIQRLFLRMCTDFKNKLFTIFKIFLTLKIIEL